MSEEPRIAVVTGASRGIGKSIAIALAEAGYSVACVATSLGRAKVTSDEIVASGGVAAPFGCNVGDAAAVESLAKAVEAELGVATVLINNAGITRDTLILRMKDSDWDDVINVNLKGSFLTIRAFVKGMMKARFGRIVNLASVIGQHGASGQANYAASKAGLEGLTKTVAKEFGSRGITCNAIAPGFIETDMTAELGDEMKENVRKTAPIPRLGLPEDIAGAVLFFVSAQAGYVTGQTLTIDGGLML